jgi:hypothetical protein
MRAASIDPEIYVSGRLFDSLLILSSVNSGHYRKARNAPNFILVVANPKLDAKRVCRILR